MAFSECIFSQCRSSHVITPEGTPIFLQCLRGLLVCPILYREWSRLLCFINPMAVGSWGEPRVGEGLSEGEIPPGCPVLWGLVWLLPRDCWCKARSGGFRSSLLSLALVCPGKSACRQSWTSCHTPSVLQLPPLLTPVPHLRMTRLLLDSEVSSPLPLCVQPDCGIHTNQYLAFKSYHLVAHKVAVLKTHMSLLVCFLGYNIC